MPWEHVKYLLAGLFDGDGTRGKRRVQLVSASKRFATEVFLLLQEHEFSPNISYGSKIHQITIHRQTDFKRFLKEVPLKRITKSIPKMNENISNGILNNSYKGIRESQKIFPTWRKLVNVEEIPGDDVYNIEVENTHTYIAMGFINHNCPGQHDAVRRADPQPAVGKEYTKDLLGYKNIHFIGSPSWFEPSSVSPAMQERIDNEVKKIVDNSYSRAIALIKKYKNKLDKVATALLKKENLDRDDFESIVGKK